MLLCVLLFCVLVFGLWVSLTEEGESDGVEEGEEAVLSQLSHNHTFYLKTTLTDARDEEDLAILEAEEDAMLAETDSDDEGDGGGYEADGLGNHHGQVRGAHASLSAVCVCERDEVGLGQLVTAACGQHR